MKRTRSHMSAAIVAGGALTFMVAGGAQAASRQSTAATQTIVTVDKDPSDGSIGVSTQLGNQPLLSAEYYTRGELCAGFSYEIPFCVGVPVQQA